jgi:hypothetical protein
MAWDGGYGCLGNIPSLPPSSGFVSGSTLFLNMIYSSSGRAEDYPNPIERFQMLGTLDSTGGHSSGAFMVVGDSCFGETNGVFSGQKK